MTETSTALKTRLCLLLLAILGLRGCASAPAPSEAALLTADYGQPPQQNYRDLIKQEIGKSLIDPYSAQYEIGEPAKGYTVGNSLYNTPKAYGWRVCGTVNSRNRMGGYVGRAPFFTLLRDGKILVAIVGNGAGADPITNAHIEASCSRAVSSK